MSQIRCKHCHRWVPANPRIKDQQYCGRKKCQRARKAEWQKSKLKVDPQYKSNQEEARAKWRRNNPGHSKQYRDANPAYCDRNRELLKKRDQKRRNKITGPAPPDIGAVHMDASVAENIINIVFYNESTGHLAKMDASTDKFIIIPSIYIDLAKMDNID